MKTADQLLRELEPYLDSIVCYASTMSEHEGNRIAKEVRDYLARVGAGEERPSIDNPLSPYGLLVRALRIAAGVTLMDMSKDLKVSPAALSNYEFGRSLITDDVLFGAYFFFKRNGIPTTFSALNAAASKSNLEYDERNKRKA
ncbi:putative transcriptional regulator [Burkholderia phage Maja]|uniref:Putative transcriptional regulator n=1 Tax=Burkholderia phage Maja TaxID=2767571 RepID=A0A7S6R8W9_9CAUD|nr:putative transcriptional regulator [Burkholderia phage Maja]